MSTVSTLLLSMGIGFLALSAFIHFAFSPLSAPRVSQDCLAAYLRQAGKKGDED